MSTSAMALVGYAAWTLVLLGAIAGMRGVLVLSGKRRANDFQPDGADVSPFSQRLCRSHANCYENLPVFAALVLAALVSGRGGITDPVVMWVLGARIAQSVVHLLSTSPTAVLARFGLFLVQYVLLVWVAWRLLVS